MGLLRPVGGSKVREFDADSASSSHTRSIVIQPTRLSRDDFSLNFIGR
jgi:hypothetical protein